MQQGAKRHPGFGSGGPEGRGSPVDRKDGGHGRRRAPGRMTHLRTSDDPPLGHRRAEGRITPDPAQDAEVMNLQASGQPMDFLGDVGV
ncbi:MAG: hypothetical protein EBY17_29875 [Acidobacteriia bacterium]|nr:hypothetical protein [Terriglobia bacterium]